MRRYTRIILTAKVTARAALISSTKLAAKNVMIKENGSLSRYEPMSRSSPNRKKKDRYQHQHPL